MSDTPAVGFYERSILPRLIHAGMRHERFREYRRRLVADARGRVLEIGCGSGLNLPLYRDASIIGLDPSYVALLMAHDAARGIRQPVSLLEASAEAIPLESHSVDSVVTAWTLCSIPDAALALHELRRVLSSSGRLFFVEHGRSSDVSVARWQDRLTPVWKRVAGGCHLNRPIARLIEDSGFVVERVETHYMTGPRPLTFMYEGTARPR